MRHRRQRPLPYAPPIDGPPLHEVAKQLREKTAHLNAQDTEIAKHIDTLETKLRAMKVERILSVKLANDADLGWSYNRRTKQWRFVIRTEDDAWELRSCSREERVEVFTSGAMTRLVALAQQ